MQNAIVFSAFCSKQTKPGVFSFVINEQRNSGGSHQNSYPGGGRVKERGAHFAPDLFDFLIFLTLVLIQPHSSGFGGLWFMLACSL